VKHVFEIAGLVPFLAVLTHDDLSFWERMLEKWGIGLIGLGLFVFLAKWTAKREENLQKARDEREKESQTERVALLARNNELQLELLKAINTHAKKAEDLTREATLANKDNAAAMRMLVRKMKRPCVNPIDDYGAETYPGSQEQ